MGDGAQIVDGRKGFDPRVGRARPRHPLGGLLLFARRQPVGAACGLFILAIVVCAALSGAIAPHPWALVNNKVRLQPPDLSYPLGTDQFGRDLLSRMLRGARVSLWVGLGATVVGVGVATVIGLVSAYAGGPADYMLQRLVDVLQSIPPLVLLIGILIVLGPGVTHIIVALAFYTAFVSSRVARGSALTVLNNAHVDAARAVGAGHLRIMIRHLLPNIFGPMIVIATVNLGVNILAEASLSFLGYGIPPPEPSWGGMLGADGRRFMVSAPWMLAAPAVGLTALVFAVNMLGDALRDALDPRMRGT
jgi:peptide/nickel transport system permease protein